MGVTAQSIRRRSAGAALAAVTMLVGLLMGVGQRPAAASPGDPLVPTLIKDINPGAKSSDAAFYVQKGNELFFLTFVNDFPSAASGLWKTDGTPSGTQLVKAVATGTYIPQGQTPSAHLTLVGDTLFFAGDDGTHGTELWKSDGTAAGTTMVKDIEPTPGYTSLPSYFSVLGGKLLFKATTQANGSELWTSDGTDGGTAMLQDINPGASDGSPANVTVIGDTAYFAATDGSSTPAHGNELWKTDGSSAGTVMVKDINATSAGVFPNSPPNVGNSDPAGFVALGSTVYFSATDGNNADIGRHGNELWKTDGTEAGTAMVTEINPLTTSGFFNTNASSSSPSNLTVLGDSMLFAANDGSTGSELWKSDGTAAGTVQVKEINTTDTAGPYALGSAPVHLFRLGDIVYFAANDGTATGSHGYELWKSDGTAAGTVLVKDINPGPIGSSTPGGDTYSPVTTFTAVGPDLYFSANDDTHGRELWKTDGTEAGTVLVRDLNPGTGDSSPASLTPAFGTLFFTANGAATPTATSTAGTEPWVLGPSILPTLSVNDPAVAEGDAGTTTATFTVTRAGATNLGSSVQYKTLGGTATAGTDYTAIPSSTLIFAPGETSKAVAVDVSGDTLPEANETFNLVLSAPGGAALADPSGTASIVNDDGTAYLTVSDISVTEGNTGTTPATFTVTRSGNTTGTSTVKYKTGGGTATAGTDYTSVPLSTTPLTFGPGQTTQTVTVDVAGDTTDENNETLNLLLSTPSSGTTISDASGTATIVDDDGPITPAPATFLTVGDISLNEGPSGTTGATFTVTRSGSTAGTSTVKFKTSGGTATAGTDYTAPPLSAPPLSFAAGETSKTVTVDVNGDNLPEPDETFNLVLSTPSGAVISDASGTATIRNDDGSAFLTVNNVSVVEGNTGTTSATFTVTRSGNNAGVSTVKFKTSGGTATAGTDYTALQLSATPLTFADGETSKTVTVDVTGDTTVEPNETFNLVLSTPSSGTTIADAAGMATIVNDD